MKKILLYWIVLTIGSACHKQEKEDQLLWKYYETFAYPPEEVDKLLVNATSEDAALFLKGLKVLEEFDLTSDTAKLKVARQFFDQLIQQTPDDYKGYLGNAMSYTEWGSLTKNDSIKKELFKKAFVNYGKANNRRRDFAPILYYWARALYHQDHSTLSDSALLLLEQATHLRKNFFKAHERAAQFLSGYYNQRNESLIRKALTRNYPDIKQRIKYHFEESLKGNSSWYQTYEGIADAKSIYTPYERVHYLEKGLAIASKQKSKDTVLLVEKRNYIFLRELSNHDMVNVSEKKVYTTEEADLLAEKRFYFDEKDSTNTKVSVASVYFYARYWENKNVDSALLNFDKAMALENDTLAQSKIKFEKAKFLWTKQPQAALNLLKQLMKELPDKPIYYPLYNKCFYLREFIEKSKKDKRTTSP
jgi:hypothetical protein